ncbi:MAG: hypothetical protein OHK0046_08690 [Anaerolineae bacterium]
MMYKCEDQLRSRAESFIQTLLAADVQVASQPAMFRDYTVKLAVKGGGYINIYYSPTKDTFSLKLHELGDKSLAPIIEFCWQSFSSVTPAIHQSPDYQAYVNGTYAAGVVGYGAVVLYQSQEKTRWAGKVTQHADMRQVAGELEATLLVLDWCRSNYLTEIEVHYDYDGIEKWATGEWRGNTSATRLYQERVKSLAINIKWHKIKRGTVNTWITLIQELSQQATAIEPSNVSQEDLLHVLEAAANGFTTYLVANGIVASFTDIHNNQFARIVVEKGYFDLYNTHKRSLSPYLHGFTEACLKNRIEELWRLFQRESVGDAPAPAVNPFEAVEYYLAIFEPYSHLAFDFSILAESLQPLITQEIFSNLDPTNYRQMKDIYEQLRTNHHDGLS